MAEKPRILVIDDDPGIRDAFKEIFSPSRNQPVYEKGAALFAKEASQPVACPSEIYDVSIVENGESGIKAVEQALENNLPYAVAFIDMNMTGIDGAETSRRIWELDRRIKIVIVTASGEYSRCDIISIARRKDLFYIRKPFTIEEIKQFASALVHHWTVDREKEILVPDLKKSMQNSRKRCHFSVCWATMSPKN